MPEVILITILIQRGHNTKVLSIGGCRKLILNKINDQGDPINLVDSWALVS